MVLIECVHGIISMVNESGGMGTTRVCIAQHHTSMLHQSRDMTRHTCGLGWA